MVARIPGTPRVPRLPRPGSLPIIQRGPSTVTVTVTEAAAATPICDIDKSGRRRYQVPSAVRSFKARTTITPRPVVAPLQSFLRHPGMGDCVYGGVRHYAGFGACGAGRRECAFRSHTAGHQGYNEH